VLADGDTLATEGRLLFDNEDAAAEDKAAREKLLRESTSSVTNEPIPDVLEVDAITVVGASETSGACRISWRPSGEGCCRRFPASIADETSTRRPHVDG
jgi:hypothetical protein